MRLHGTVVRQTWSATLARIRHVGTVARLVWSGVLSFGVGDASGLDPYRAVGRANLSVGMLRQHRISANASGASLTVMSPQ